MTSEGMGPADIAALTRNGNGYGGEGGGLWWIIILFLFAFVNGSWGNNGNNGSYAGQMYPWLNQSNQINEGFQNQMIYDNISGIREGVYGLGPQLCNGFAGVTAAVNNGFAQAEISENARQMAFMQQLFGLSQQLSQCCCDNRLATCQTQNIVQQEGSQTRFADANNTRDIIAAITAGVQSVKDQLCEYRNAQKDETIANLRQELMFSRGQASQVEQTAQLLANNNAQTALFQQGLNNEVDQLYNRLNNCPVGTVPVYGKTPIFNCNNGMGGCGCGCGAA